MTRVVWRGIPVASETAIGVGILFDKPGRRQRIVRKIRQRRERSLDEVAQGEKVLGRRRSALLESRISAVSVPVVICFGHGSSVARRHKVIAKEELGREALWPNS